MLLYIITLLIIQVLFFYYKKMSIEGTAREVATEQTHSWNLIPEQGDWVRNNPERKDVELSPSQQFKEIATEMHDRIRSQGKNNTYIDNDGQRITIDWFPMNWWYGLAIQKEKLLPNWDTEISSYNMEEIWWIFNLIVYVNWEIKKEVPNLTDDEISEQLLKFKKRINELTDFENKQENIKKQERIKEIQEAGEYAHLHDVEEAVNFLTNNQSARDENKNNIGLW